jgi:hypothetical protein
MDCRQMNRHCAEITKLAFALPSKAVTGIEAAFRLAYNAIRQQKRAKRIGLNVKKFITLVI